MICVYDLETTGLLKTGNSSLPGIIQIAAILLDKDGVEWGEFETRVDPELSPLQWEQGAIKITGIGPGDVGKDWPSFFSVFPDFADFIGKATILSGYNIEHYDDQVLFNNLVRYGFEKHFPWPRHRIDVMKLSKDHQGKRGNRSPKLVEIYKELFDEEIDGAHDAMVDVRATARVLLKIGQHEMERLT